MKLPGSLRALRDQLEALGYVIAGELRFDEKGHLIGLPIRAARPEELAAKGEPAKPKGPVRLRRSPMTAFGRTPMADPQ